MFIARTDNSSYVRRTFLSIIWNRPDAHENIMSIIISNILVKYYVPFHIISYKNQVLNILHSYIATAICILAYSFSYIASYCTYGTVLAQDGELKRHNKNII